MLNSDWSASDDLLPPTTVFLTASTLTGYHFYSNRDLYDGRSM